MLLQQLVRQFICECQLCATCINVIILAIVAVGDWCRFGDAGCYTLCDGLRRSCKLTSLSLNYCKLGPTCGMALGYLVSTTAVVCVFLLSSLFFRLSFIFYGVFW